MAEFESPDGFSEEEREYKWLPTMVDFHNSGAQSRALVGPVGSGKTTSGTFEVCMYLPHFLWEHYGIKKTRWVVIRNCYDPDTEVLTEESGWVKFRDLNEDAAIAIRKDGYLEYEVPKLHYRAPYKGEMVGIRQQGVDLLVTPDHHLWASTRRTRKKIWSEYECVKAQDIYGHDGLHRFCATADWRGKPINKSKDFFEFLGFWFAEGSASILPRKDCAGVHYRLNVTQKGDRAYVSGLLTRAGLTYGVSTTSGEVDHYRISTRSEEMKDLIHELSDYGKSLTKWIPDYVKQAPKEYIKAFLFGFQKGDGSFKTGPKDCDRLYTSSPQLADDLHELLVKAGKHAVIGCRLQFGKPQYTITIHTDKRESPEIRKSHWRKEQYDGEVFCVEVSTHVILVRRNGKAVWCGQSYPQLRDTTMRTVFEWFPQGKRHVQESRYVLRWPISDPGSRHEGSELEVEILFRACDRPDDIDNFKSLEVTGAWIDEANEVPEEVKRIIKTRVGRFPRKCPTRFLIETTNPMHVEHPMYSQFKWNWLPERAPAPPGVPLKNHLGFWQPPRENEANLRPGYYDDLISDYADNPDWADLYVEGMPGVTIRGKLVYANFRKDIHIAKRPLEWAKGILYRGWDNSGNTPACIVGQLPKPHHFEVLKEFTTDREGIVDFSKRVTEACNSWYPGAEWIDWGDPAGGNTYSRKEGGFTSNAKLMLDECSIKVRSSNQNLVARIQSVDQALARIDGLTIDPSCVRLENGFLGGYCYKIIPGTGEYSVKPIKNMWSHPHEALQYVLVKLLRSTRHQPGRDREKKRCTGVHIPGSGWMRL